MQMELANDIYNGLYNEYSLRRRMLVERAKVTLDSFLRSAQLKERGTQEEARRVAEAGASRMLAEPLVTFDSMFQACQGELCKVEGRAMMHIFLSTTYSVSLRLMHL